MSPVESVCRAVNSRQLQQYGGVIVVALDGRSGVGKSTLASTIARDLGAAVVHIDDFYRDMPDAERRALSPADGVDRYFDWQRLRSEALDPLKARKPARFRCYDWVSGHGLADWMTIEPREVLIVEGVYSARPEFDDFVDLKVLVLLQREQLRSSRRERVRDEPRRLPIAMANFANTT